MITTNVFQRTFFIKFGEATGTAFTIDVDKKQYLVTARHVCTGIKDGDDIGIYHNGKWLECRTRVVGQGAEGQIETDVAVLALSAQISPSHPLPASSKDVTWGQDVYFLGFPYGLHTAVGVNNGYPLPLVKGAIMSGSGGTKGSTLFLLDGHNNPGFSGGPVVFKSNSSGNEFRVMAIVSAYRAESVDVTFQGKPTGLINQANTGIVVCPAIEQATALIAANPIGPAITT